MEIIASSVDKANKELLTRKKIKAPKKSVNHVTTNPHQILKTAFLVLKTQFYATFKESVKFLGGIFDSPFSRFLNSMGISFTFAPIFTIR